MRGITGLVFWSITFIFIVSHFYSCRSLQFILKRKKKLIGIIYSCIGILFLYLWFRFYYNPLTIRQANHYTWFYITLGLCVLILIPDVILTLGYSISSYYSKFRYNSKQADIIRKGSLLLAVPAVVLIVYSFTAGINTLVIQKIEIKSGQLPPSIGQLRLVQISDLHLGSFSSTRLMKKCVTKVNRLEPDIVLITGDLVNNFANEMTSYNRILSGIKAPLGVYAILGNHDYGQYSDWKSIDAQKADHQKLLKQINQDRIHILLNSSIKIPVKDTCIYLCGTENWDEKPQYCFADFQKTFKDVPDSSFSILMTHEPDAWKKQVIGKYPAFLTLSGHTHGGQLALKLGGISFSPFRIKEKYCTGLFQAKKQYLYVNRGIGTIGLRARLAMTPEITLLTINSQKESKAIEK